MGSQEFRVAEQSRRGQALAIVASLFFIAAVALALRFEPQLRTPLGYTVAAAVIVFLLWVLVGEVRTGFGRKDTPIIIDEHGVRYVSPGEIAWSEVAGLEPVPAAQRVDLLDKQGRARVSLGYDLEEAEEVIQLVADMLADRWPRKPLPHDFGRRSSRALLAAGVLLIGALGAGMYWVRDRSLVELLCLAALAMLVFGYLVMRVLAVQRLTVSGDGVAVAKGIGRNALSFKEVGAVGLAVVNGRGERHLDVRLTMRDSGAAVYVLPRDCDPFDVYATVRAAWERSRTAAAKGPVAPEEPTAAPPSAPVSGLGGTGAPMPEPRRYQSLKSSST